MVLTTGKPPPYTNRDSSFLDSGDFNQQHREGERTSREERGTERSFRRDGYTGSVFRWCVFPARLRFPATQGCEKLRSGNSWYILSCEYSKFLLDVQYIPSKYECHMKNSYGGCHRRLTTTTFVVIFPSIYHIGTLYAWNYWWLLVKIILEA